MTIQAGWTCFGAFRRHSGLGSAFPSDSDSQSSAPLGKCKFKFNVARGIFTCGVSVLGSCVKMPRILSKNLISVIFCEAVAIYGVIVAIILNGKVGSSNTYYTYHNNSSVWQQAEYAGFATFAVGLIVGFSNLVCGLSVGVIGSSTALTHA